LDYDFFEFTISLLFCFWASIKNPDKETPHPIPMKNINNFAAIVVSGKSGIDAEKAKTANITACIMLCLLTLFSIIAPFYSK